MMQPGAMGGGAAPQATPGLQVGGGREGQVQNGNSALRRSLKNMKQYCLICDSSVYADRLKTHCGKNGCIGELGPPEYPREGIRERDPVKDAEKAARDAAKGKTNKRGWNNAWDDWSWLSWGMWGPWY